ncbi:hypothetical protein G6M89_00675 [Natronolimnobius sp. AArcel1]|uniref:type IV pilus modification PilV family protein n=1 Tax=Natronolimnobius sp. AArcel1 TaxID=1679093 RepID=UPI0013EE2B75|nr:hypothetical protein [Natronolimnobius sp. AArcel1]NGM67533.1 hypothetical protein [Natronolimnobius sp. AArcel1]
MRDNRCTVEITFARDDRGVSEVLAFVLVFGIILTSVAILSVTGFQAMDSYQESEQQQNADRAMQTLADNFNDVLRYDGLEERYGELTVRGGTVTVDGDGGPELDIEVDGNQLTDTDGFEHLENSGDSIPLGSLTYESGSDTISYEGGAVAREAESGGGLFLSDPKLQYNDDVAILSLVKIDGDRQSIQSDGSQGFSVSVKNRTSKLVKDDVEISVSGGDESEIWEDYLDEAHWNNEDMDRILITIVEVEIDY